MQPIRKSAVTAHEIAVYEGPARAHPHPASNKTAETTSEPAGLQPKIATTVQTQTNQLRQAALPNDLTEPQQKGSEQQ
jgi:hypothetical protein